MSEKNNNNSEKEGTDETRIFSMERRPWGMLKRNFLYFAGFSKEFSGKILDF
jgi:hypothetical protein